MVSCLAELQLTWIICMPVLGKSIYPHLNMLVSRPLNGSNDWALLAGWLKQSDRVVTL